MNTGYDRTLGATLVDVGEVLLASDPATDRKLLPDHLETSPSDYASGFGARAQDNATRRQPA